MRKVELLRQIDWAKLASCIVNAINEPNAPTTTAEQEDVELTTVHTGTAEEVATSSSVPERTDTRVREMLERYRDTFSSLLNKTDPDRKNGIITTIYSLYLAESWDTHDWRSVNIFQKDKIRHILIDACGKYSNTSTDTLTAAAPRQQIRAFIDKEKFFTLKTLFLLPCPLEIEALADNAMQVRHDHFNNPCVQPENWVALKNALLAATQRYQPNETQSGFHRKARILRMLEEISDADLRQITVDPSDSQAKLIVIFDAIVFSQNVEHIGPITISHGSKELKTAFLKAYAEFRHWKAIGVEDDVEKAYVKFLTDKAENYYDVTGTNKELWMSRLEVPLPDQGFQGLLMSKSVNFGQLLHALRAGLADYRSNNVGGDIGKLRAENALHDLESLAGVSDNEGAAAGQAVEYTPDVAQKIAKIFCAICCLTHSVKLKNFIFEQLKPVTNHVRFSPQQLAQQFQSYYDLSQYELEEEESRLTSEKWQAPTANELRDYIEALQKVVLDYVQSIAGDDSTIISDFKTKIKIPTQIPKEKHTGYLRAQNLYSSLENCRTPAELSKLLYIFAEYTSSKALKKAVFLHIRTTAECFKTEFKNASEQPPISRSEHPEYALEPRLKQTKPDEYSFNLNPAHALNFSEIKVALAEYVNTNPDERGRERARRFSSLLDRIQECRDASYTEEYRKKDEIALCAAIVFASDSTKLREAILLSLIPKEASDAIINTNSFLRGSGSTDENKDTIRSFWSEQKLHEFMLSNQISSFYVWQIAMALEEKPIDQKSRLACLQYPQTTPSPDLLLRNMITAVDEYIISYNKKKLGKNSGESGFYRAKHLQKILRQLNGSQFNETQLLFCAVTANPNSALCKRILICTGEPLDRRASMISEGQLSIEIITLIAEQLTQEKLGNAEHGKETLKVPSRGYLKFKCGDAHHFDFSQIFENSIGGDWTEFHNVLKCSVEAYQPGENNLLGDNRKRVLLAELNDLEHQSLAEATSQRRLAVWICTILLRLDSTHLLRKVIYSIPMFKEPIDAAVRQWGNIENPEELQYLQETYTYNLHRLPGRTNVTHTLFANNLRIYFQIHKSEMEEKLTLLNTLPKPAAAPSTPSRGGLFSSAAGGSETQRAIPCPITEGWEVLKNRYLDATWEILGDNENLYNASGDSFVRTVIANLQSILQTQCVQIADDPSQQRNLLITICSITVCGPSSEVRKKLYTAAPEEQTKQYLKQEKVTKQVLQQRYSQLKRPAPDVEMQPLGNNSTP